MRFVVLFIVVALLFWLLKRFFTSRKAEEQEPMPQSETMKPCDHCGLHVPESLLIHQNNHSYCCQEHAELDNG
ncbi:MAG: hypothetical protein ACI845_002927 [Gammaproteobacteria bacterium]|jgi:uncharacterized protein